jgi:hypothetical protein
MRRITIHQPSPNFSPPARPALELREHDALWALIHPDTLEDLHARGTERAALHSPETRSVPVILRSGGVIDDAASAFASWSGAGWSAFEDAVRALVEPDTAPAPVLIWPGTGSVLSDAVSTLSFARRHDQVGLVIDPVAWITDAMAADAPDHLARFASALTLCETVRAVVIRPCQPGGLSAAQVGVILRPLVARAGAAIATAEDLATV